MKYKNKKNNNTNISCGGTDTEGLSDASAAANTTGGDVVIQ